MTEGWLGPFLGKEERRVFVVCVCVCVCVCREGRGRQGERGQDGVDIRAKMCVSQAGGDRGARGALQTPAGKGGLTGSHREVGGLGKGQQARSPGRRRRGCFSITLAQHQALPAARAAQCPCSPHVSAPATPAGRSVPDRPRPSHGRTLTGHQTLSLLWKPPRAPHSRLQTL